jgi:hypothetical protein
MSRPEHAGNKYVVGFAIAGLRSFSGYRRCAMPQRAIAPHEEGVTSMNATGNCSSMHGWRQGVTGLAPRPRIASVSFTQKGFGGALPFIGSTAVQQQKVRTFDDKYTFGSTATESPG